MDSSIPLAFAFLVSALTAGMEWTPVSDRSARLLARPGDGRHLQAPHDGSRRRLANISGMVCATATRKRPSLAVLRVRSPDAE